MKTGAAISALKKRAEFLAVAAAKKKWVTRNILLQAGPSSITTQIRFGLTASSKVGGAVVRNKARRRLRALALEVLPEHAKPEFDYVLIARKDTPTCEFDNLRRDLVNGLKYLRAWK